jgi:hypothetical protein
VCSGDQRVVVALENKEDLQSFQSAKKTKSEGQVEIS